MSEEVKNSDLNGQFEESKGKSKSEEKKKKIIILAILGISLLLFIILIVPKGRGSKKEKENGEEKTQQVVYQESEEKFEEIEDDNDKLSREEMALLEETLKKREEAVKEYEIQNESRENENSSPMQRNKDLNNSREQSLSNVPQAPAQPYKYTPSNEMKKRMDSDYLAIVSAFKSNLEKNSWELGVSEYQKILEGSNKINMVEEPLKNLYDSADVEVKKSNMIIGAATRITAVTEQPVSSDHPGMFTAKIVRPFEIKGMKLLCKSGDNVRGRIPCQIIKLVDRDNREYSINGQVEMKGCPGISGKIKSNWHKRLGPSLINTAIGGGFIAWQMQNEVDSIRIDSRDAVYGPIIQNSVDGLQSEISRLGGDYPDTVIIPRGKQFAILLQEGVTIEI